ncbi:hypothetical protein SAY87_014045 [Trapa incisa]|uniref:Uncharacterized protein n=1 Tax=Trapa incisa TaxID=236973 RepID=A0AAN7JK18_9MYRT|nr:hypothetical protein SAY87_014045 [Trapa incisa]
MGKGMNLSPAEEAGGSPPSTPSPKLEFVFSRGRSPEGHADGNRGELLHRGEVAPERGSVHREPIGKCASRIREVPVGGRVCVPGEEGGGGGVTPMATSTWGYGGQTSRTAMAATCGGTASFLGRVL